jgi:glycosyltransferase involved in cell wall biosynthesis
MRVLFIVPYPADLSPSQRFRFEQYLGLMQLQGYQYEIHSFLLPHNWKLFGSRGSVLKKIAAVVTGYARRIPLLARASQFDRIFIHREAVPLGPPLMEWLIAKVLRKKIIYDFDDAIWLTDRRNESPIARVLRWRTKVESVCRMSYRVSCGNNYLASFAKQFNTSVVVNPTTIDTGFHKPASDNARNSSHTITIGWTGTQSTLKYLEPLGKVVAGITAKYPGVTFCVIADSEPSFAWPAMRFVRWEKATEVVDLQKIDIGVMPLPDDDWSKGKCGFKALQYMSLAIPTVASPVGVNTEIIQHGQNGLLATTDDDWLDCLDRLIRDEALRRTLGAAGAQTVRDRYSVDSNANLFLSLFD